MTGTYITAVRRDQLRYSCAKNQVTTKRNEIFVANYKLLRVLSEEHA